MTPRAAGELLDVIMLDDYIARRRALDTWVRRWLVTSEVILKERRAAKLGYEELGLLPAMRRAAALGEIFKGFGAPDAPPVLHLERGPDEPGLDANIYVARMHFVRQEPYE